MMYNKNNLAITEACEAKSKSRPELGGVLFKSDRTVATDAYILMEVVNDMATIKSLKEDVPDLLDMVPSIPKEGFLIPAKSVNKFSKNLADCKHKNLPVLDWGVLGKRSNKDESQLICTDLEKTDIVKTKNIDAKYPDYKHVIPTKKPQASILIGLNNLKRVVNALSKMELAGIGGTLEIELHGTTEAFVIKAKTDQNQEVKGLIMPIRE